MGSARRLRGICWALIVLAIVSALIDIGVQLGRFVTVALPIWAFMLARRAPELATATSS